MGFLVAVQFFITMLFFPLRIGACGHISLAHDKLEADVTFLGLSIVKVRIRQYDGKFRLSVNGKQIKPKKKLSLTQIKNVTEQYKIEGIKIGGNLLALVGTQDAMSTALACAFIGGLLQPILKNFQIFSAIPSDTLEIDGRVKIKINFVQIINLIFAGLRGENG